MGTPFEKLHQSLKDMIESISKIEEQLEDKSGGDEEAVVAGLVEACEAAIESALDELDTPGSFLAQILNTMSDALESVDPSSYEEESELEEYEDDEDDDDDIDDDDVDDDYDEEDDDEDE